VRLPIVLNPPGYTRKGRQRLKYFGCDPGSRAASCSSSSDTSSTRQNRPLWQLFRQQADIQRVKKSLSHGSDTECKPRDCEMLDLDRYSGVNVLTSNTPIDPQCKSRKCKQIHAFTLGKNLHRASKPIVNRSTRVCGVETRYAHFIQHLPRPGMRAKCQTREADG